VKHGLEVIHATNRVEIPWVDGKVHGVRRTFHAPAPDDPDGEPRLHTETTYENDVAHGPSRSIDRDGRPLREGVMRHGKRHGTTTDYWPRTGKPRRIVEYSDGAVVGVAREFYADGRLKRTVPFRAGMMHGKEEQYEADGRLTRTRFWFDGAEVTADEFRQMAAAEEEPVR
jgi:antitoxin component YwqK of YwqJK toxin-antitoxin module